MEESVSEPSDRPPTAADGFYRERVSEPAVLSGLVGVEEVSFLTVSRVRAAGVDLGFVTVNSGVTNEVRVRSSRAGSILPRRRRRPSGSILRVSRSGRAGEIG